MHNNIYEAIIWNGGSPFYQTEVVRVCLIHYVPVSKKESVYWCASGINIILWIFLVELLFSLSWT
jgi:hypothetical protein